MDECYECESFRVCYLCWGDHIFVIIQFSWLPLINWMINCDVGLAGS